MHQMLVRAHGVRRLMDDGLATEELRLSRPHDQHEHHTEQDQPEAQDEHQPDPSDTGAAAIMPGSALSCRVMIKDEEETESAEQREQELEDEVVRAFEETMAEEPDTTEGRQAVVEADHDAQREMVSVSTRSLRKVSTV